MASRRLLLFADGNSTSNENFNFDGNITLECIFNCIGVCISGICVPTLPLPPVSLPLDNSTDGTTPIILHHGDRITPTLIITVVSAVAGAFALLLTLYAYLRFRRRARRHHRHPGSEAAADAIDGNGDEIGGDFPPDGEVEHHIWYIRTQGLDDSTIASITSWIYKSSDGLIDSKDCSVCLGEFYDGELVRLLPKCSHAFHLPCIDRWLRSHVNCPLCRAPVVSPAAATVLAPSPASPETAISSDAVEQVTGSPAPLETTQVEALPWESVSEEFEIGIVIHPSEGSSSRPSTSELPPNLEEEENLQPIRRSVSMDNFSLDVLIIFSRSDHQQQPATESLSCFDIIYNHVILQFGNKIFGAIKGKWVLDTGHGLDTSVIPAFLEEIGQRTNLIA